MTWVSPMQAGIGVRFGPLDVSVVNKKGSTIAQGDCVMFDIFNLSGAVTTYGFNKEGSAYSIVVQPSSVSTAGSATPAYNAKFYGIALEAIANNMQGQVRLQGVVKANVNNPGVSTALPGTGVIAQVSGDVLQTAPGTARASVLGFIHSGVSAGATSSVEILFNGLGGISIQ